MIGAIGGGMQGGVAALGAVNTDYNASSSLFIVAKAANDHSPSGHHVLISSQSLDYVQTITESLLLAELLSQTGDSDKKDSDSSGLLLAMQLSHSLIALQAYNQTMQQAGALAIPSVSTTNTSMHAASLLGGGLAA
jgi:hypothetical protein